jgi:hypothetical protein
VGNIVTDHVRHKYRQGLIAVVILGVLTLVINTYFETIVPEDIRISIIAFSAAAGCVLGLKYLVHKIQRKAE